MAMNANYFDLPLNMDRVCRVCLTESTNLSPIFCSGQQVDTNFSDLSQKIQICGSVDVHEQDGLPSLICDVCIYKASVAYEFRQQCQHSDARLRLFYNKPARTNIMDSETQTEPQSRVIITKAAANPQQIYFIKEELQTSSNNPHEYPPTEETFITQPVEPQEQHHPVLSETQLNMNEEPKLYECNFGFTTLKENGKDSEGVAEEIVPHEGSVGIRVEHVEEGLTIPQEIPVSQTAEIILNSQCNEVIEKVPETTENPTLPEEYLNGSIDLNSSEVLEDHQVPQKRTPARKAKIHTNNGTSTYSEEDDEMDNDFYDPSSDSQDSEELKFKCKVCSKRYATHKGLKKHSLVHEKKHKCNTCFKLFYKEENLEKHKKIHTSKPHACQLCHASFSKSQSLVRHLKSHTDKVNDIIKQINTTGIDNEDVKISKRELKDEEDSNDDEERTPPRQNHENSLTDDFQEPPGLFKCDICNQYCSSMKNLKRHSLLHGEKKYSCTVCKKWFFRPDTLKKHAEKHGHGLLDNLMDDNKLYDDSDDDDNNQQFPNIGQRDSNVIKKEEDNNEDEDANGEYKCQHCDKVMATKKGLRRHVSMHKPKAEPVTCEICKKVCASQARLILHQKTHNKPKEKVPREYLCHICSKVYPSNSSLTYHMRTHTGIKPHVCKTCNSGFTTTTSLANHIRIHTGDKPFVCHVCSAAFAVSSAFRRHLTRHTGEANYLCKTCGKAFKRLSTLKEHTYTHSGEKPYVCKTCGAAYSHSGSLFAHQKRCRAQYGEMTVVEDHHHNVAHHIHVNNVQSAVRSLAVIGQMF